MVPTLSVSAGLEESIRDGSFPYGEKAMQRSLGLAQETSEAVALAYKRGVPLALGTDASMPYVWHGKNAREFELLVNCGVSPMDALVAGTSAAAKNLGIFHETGSITTGKLADLVVVDGDPLKNIRILQDPNAIKLVLKAGQVAVNRF
jgi:imidazolonepropionase-like amidohydrolase